MKILKKGNKFVAYRDENDNGELFHDGIKVGDSLGQISIKTGKFSGNTICLVELNNHLRDYLKPFDEKYEELIDAVIDEIKSDISKGDVTVLDELLRRINLSTLIDSLPEERWSEFKSLRGFCRNDC